MSTPRKKEGRGSVPFQLAPAIQYYDYLYLWGPGWTTSITSTTNTWLIAPPPPPEKLSRRTIMLTLGRLWHGVSQMRADGTICVWCW